MRTERPAHPIGWDPYSDPVYFQFHKYYKEFQDHPSRDNAKQLYDLMLGRVQAAIQGAFDAIAHYIQPRRRQDAFVYFQNALWALHDYLFHPESDPAMARMWLSNFWVMLF